MLFKKIYMWVFYRFVEATFFIFLGLLKILPFEISRLVLAPPLRLLIVFLVPKRRIIKNLGAAFGEIYSPATKRGLARGVQEHFVRNLVDCFVQLNQSDHIRDIATIQGMENLVSALAKGKGVIALGAHIGNFALTGARLGMEGYRFHTLFRLPSDERLKGIINRYLVPRFYQQIIPSRPKRMAVKQILSALKRNEIVFILGDNLKKGKIQALLFGQRVPSPRGPVSLALRSGAAVVPLYLIRNYQGGLQLVIEPEMVLERNGRLSENITQNTRHIVRYLENLIRCYPDQWNWLTVRMERYQSDMAQRHARDNSGQNLS